jgi:hypothetical protein
VDLVAELDVVAETELTRLASLERRSESQFWRVDGRGGHEAVAMLPWLMTSAFRIVGSAHVGPRVESSHWTTPLMEGGKAVHRMMHHVVAGESGHEFGLNDAAIEATAPRTN